MKSFFLILALLTIGPAVAAQSGAPLNEEAGSQSLASALLHKDAAMFGALLAENATGIWSDGKVYDRADLVDVAEHGKIAEYTRYNVRSLPVDGNSTLITYDCIIQMPEGDTGLAPRYQHVSELWVKQGADSKLRFIQFTADRAVD